MSIVFSGGELIEIAIGIERRGISFYDIMAKSADNDEVKTIFETLVDMEREHIRIFEDMMHDGGEQRETEAAATGYPGYLQALIDDAVESQFYKKKYGDKLLSDTLHKVVFHDITNLGQIQAFLSLHTSEYKRK